MSNTLAKSVASAVARAPAMNSLQRQEMLRQAKLVPPEIRRFIARQSLGSQVLKKQKNYYSKVRFPFTVTADGVNASGDQVYRFTLDRKQVTAFSYGFGGDDMTAAGFPQTYRSNDADTNLIARGDTGGATVDIYGIGLHLSEVSDAFLAKLIWSEAYADITLNGSDRYALLGGLGRITAPGGLYGAGESRAVVPGVGDSVAMIGAMTNGMPHANNYYRLSDKIRWNPASKIDSKFQVRFEVKRDVSFTVSERKPGPGVTGYTPPRTGEIGTFVDVTVYLHTREITERSKQA